MSSPDLVYIRPSGSLQILSHQEAAQLSDRSDRGLNDILRQCVLAVLNTGNADDSGTRLMEKFPNFDIKVTARGRGVELVLTCPPANAFINGQLIKGLQEHVFATVRDLVYAKNYIFDQENYDENDSRNITNAVFQLLRNADVLKPNQLPNIIVCWGGHAISNEEYDYAREVGYALGMRYLSVCTGCGSGVMKAPMKGAAEGHHNQRCDNRRYVGISEPSIIAAEAPNAVVNELVIMPDIEKRLEAFVRFGHGLIIFPGGPGTLEEILYILSILLHPKNENQPLPLLLTGNLASKEYFDEIKLFVEDTLGVEALDKLQVILDAPDSVAQIMKDQMEVVYQNRKASSDAYYYNWKLHIECELQKPFDPTHENMASLNLTFDQPKHLLAAELRKAFSGIVAGNVKAYGIEAVEKHGPYQIKGDPKITAALGRILELLVRQKRMKLDSREYIPSYKIV